MTTEKALEELDAMDAQFIGHNGPTLFAEIAAAIRKQNAVRLAALKAIGSWLNDQHAEDLDSDDDSLLCHRILATGEPDGIPKCGVINAANALGTINGGPAR